MYQVPTHTRVPKLVFFFPSLPPLSIHNLKTMKFNSFVKTERERDNIILLRKKKVSLSAAATADLADSRSWALTDFCSMGVFKALDVR
jgi:hypothetical protein